MQGTGKIINFRWERYKYLFRKFFTDIKKFFVYMFSSNKKQTVSGGDRARLNNKRKKIRKFK